MNVELKVSENEKISLSSFERFEDGSGCCSVVSVKSGKFSCSDIDIYFDDLKLFYEQLKSIYENLKGKAQLKFAYEDDHITFEATSLGHIEVTGLFKENGHFIQYMEFGFEFDQSYLPEFLQQLEVVVEQEYS